MKQRTKSELLYSTNLQARSQTMPIGATKNFRGGAIVTGHRTQLTIAITDSTTTMKMGIQNKAEQK